MYDFNFLHLWYTFNEKSFDDYLAFLFQTIQFSMNTQFNCQKRFYFKLFSLIQQF